VSASSNNGGFGRRRRHAPDSRLSLLRVLGEQAVLETIFREGPITRPEISTATDLSKPTVSAAVGRLEHGGLVHAVGTRPGQRGRSPVAYVVSDRAGFVVGGDIGGTNVRVAAANLFGEPICACKRPTTKEGSRAVGVQILEMVSEVIEQAAATHGRPLALGISAPGVVDQTSGRVTSLAHNVTPEGGSDPLEVIRDRLDLPVLVDNKVNLAAVGEQWFGLARGVSTMVFIALGAGIGMGIIIDDELVRGAHGAAGEIAYLPSVGDPFHPRHRLHGGSRTRSRPPGSWLRLRSVILLGVRPGLPTTCSSSPGRVTRPPGPWWTRLHRAWARRSQPYARSLTPSWSCWGEGSARVRCCCVRSGARLPRWFRSQRGSRRACSPIAPPCRARLPSRSRRLEHSCSRREPLHPAQAITPEGVLPLRRERMWPACGKALGRDRRHDGGDRDQISDQALPRRDAGG
jgi:hypothetical protein